MSADSEDTDYFLEYLERVKESGADVYLTEYTKDSKLQEEILDYCDEHDYKVYVAETIELTVNDDAS